MGNMNAAGESDRYGLDMALNPTFWILSPARS